MADISTDKVLEMEYTTLRAEIVKRIELRYQIVAVTLTLAGIFLGVGVTKVALAVLIYPPLAVFLALAWAQNEFRIRHAAAYIREWIEPYLRPGSTVPGFEAYVQEERRAGGAGLGSWSLIVVSHGGIFLATQLMAVGVELFKMKSLRQLGGLEWLLLSIDAVAVAAVVVVMLKAAKRRRVGAERVKKRRRTLLYRRIVGMLRSKKRRAQWVPYLVLRKQSVESDWKLTEPNNNGRKVLVNKIYPDKEIKAQDPEWSPGDKDKSSPVVETGFGGVEVATFTNKAAQDCHKHLIATEVYAVLAGTLRMRLAEKEPPLELIAGDELIVLPNTPHEVLPDSTYFLARVHTINCYGEADKYVKRDGKWCQVLIPEPKPVPEQLPV